MEIMKKEEFSSIYQKPLTRYDIKELFTKFSKQDFREFAKALN